MMRTMGSSSQNKLYDPIRKSWVKQTPEELVRQKWIHYMIHELEYPVSLLSVEKELSQLPHLKGLPIPKRRFDIVAFWKNSSTELIPLLIIECKARPLTPTFARQVTGYNASVQAPFVAIANAHQILTGKYDEESASFQFTEGLPSYRKMQIFASNVSVIGQ